MANERPRDEEIAVDLTLVDAALALTPEERLRQNDRMIRTIQELRDALGDWASEARRARQG